MQKSGCRITCRNPLILHGSAGRISLMFPKLKHPPASSATSNAAFTEFPCSTTPKPKPKPNLGSPCSLGARQNEVPCAHPTGHQLPVLGASTFPLSQRWAPLVDLAHPRASAGLNTTSGAPPRSRWDASWSG